MTLKREDRIHWVCTQEQNKVNNYYFELWVIQCCSGAVQKQKYGVVNSHNRLTLSSYKKQSNWRHFLSCVKRFENWKIYAGGCRHFNASVEGKEQKYSHTHTHKKSRVAVLDIFNKLKPRYKKNQVHFIPPSPPPTSRSLNCDKHCSFPRLRVRAKHRQRIGVQRHSSYQTLKQNSSLQSRFMPWI